MVRERQVVLFRFLQTNQSVGKLRPALVIREVPGPYEDWLICMISLQLSKEVAGFDEIIMEKDDDFISSGLKQASLIRIARLAVVEKAILLGAIGEISPVRLISSTISIVDRELSYSKGSFYESQDGANTCISKSIIPFEKLVKFPYNRMNVARSWRKG